MSEPGSAGGGVALATPAAAASISVHGLTKRYGRAGVTRRPATAIGGQ